MISDKRVLALVPARGGSKGLPRKNLRMIAGQPLVAWPVAAASGSRYVDTIVCSTDDTEIATAASAAGASVPFTRPVNLSDDTASSMDVVLHTLDYLESNGESFDYVCLLEPTSPLTDSSDVDNAITLLDEMSDTADSIVGVSKVEHAHPDYNVSISADNLISPCSADDFNRLKRRQELDDVFFLDGSLYISKVEAFRKFKSFYHERTLAYVTPRWKSFEIDEYVDFVCVEALLLHKDKFL